ncbi:MAG: caspase family protein [Polyangiaceae bacterium]
MITPFQYHVLLVGVDAYGKKPLHGCVNDIDAFQRVLQKAQISADRIKRLASPHRAPGAPVPTETPATLSNIRAALKELADRVESKEDRVIFYYSGHGTRMPIAGAGGAKHNSEALVPVDFDSDPGAFRLLFDFELNHLLRNIAARTKSVCCILDCCHSAGVTREVPPKTRIARLLESADLGLVEPIAPIQLDRDQRSLLSEGQAGGSLDDCQVVTACLNHESASEDLDPAGVQHGLFTSALVAALGPFKEEQLRSLPWARVWQRMRTTVETQNPAQHLWMSGSYARAVLGGPPVDVDVGFGVTRYEGENRYRIDAGVLADVTEGAELAVYGEEPKRFPDLGKQADLNARIGSLLKVTSAENASAEACSLGAPFDPPESGARARLVKAGEGTKLRCALDPADNTLADIVKSPLVEISPQENSEVRLVQRADRAWDLCDDVAGSALPAGGTLKACPPLITLRGDAEIALARAILEHYTLYRLPIRMANRCKDLPGNLKVSLLSCPRDGLDEEVADSEPLSDAPAHAAFNYGMKVGDAFCVQIRNKSLYELRVTLLNCAASGKVELLGDQVLSPRTEQRFWLESVVGNPFVVSEVEGSRVYVDRFVAIGTTLVDKALTFLKNDVRFSELLPRGQVKAKKEVILREVTSPPAERWTATQLKLGVGF